MKKLLSIILCFSLTGCVVQTYVVPYVNAKKAGSKRQLIWNDRDTVYSMEKYTILKFRHKPTTVKTVDSTAASSTAAN